MIMAILGRYCNTYIHVHRSIAIPGMYGRYKVQDGFDTQKASFD